MYAILVSIALAIYSLILVDFSLLGNISQRVGRSLDIDQKNGHILDDPDAMKLWGREYEAGWAPSF